MWIAISCMLDLKWRRRNCLGDASGPPSPKLRRTAFAWVQLRLGEASRSSHQVFFARERRLVTQIFASWNQLDGWLRRVDGLRRAA